MAGAGQYFRRLPRDEAAVVVAIEPDNHQQQQFFSVRERSRVFDPL